MLSAYTHSFFVSGPSAKAPSLHFTRENRKLSFSPFSDGRRRILDLECGWLGLVYVFKVHVLYIKCCLELPKKSFPHSVAFADAFTARKHTSSSEKLFTYRAGRKKSGNGKLVKSKCKYIKACLVYRGNSIFSSSSFHVCSSLAGFG